VQRQQAEAFAASESRRAAIREALETSTRLQRTRQDPTEEGRGAVARSLRELACRPGVGWQDLREWLPPDLRAIEPAEAEEALLACRYAGYIERDEARRRRTRAMAEVSLAADLDYATLPGLTTEAREALERRRPETLGQASRLPGVTPAAVQALAIAVLRRRRADQRGARPSPDPGTGRAFPGPLPGRLAAETDPEAALESRTPDAVGGAPGAGQRSP
jgi:tRNA U34 5-carboxymethylaminomethyl modifying enzyme MnmG/GidA